MKQFSEIITIVLALVAGLLVGVLIAERRCV